VPNQTEHSARNAKHPFPSPEVSSWGRVRPARWRVRCRVPRSLPKPRSGARRSRRGAAWGRGEPRTRLCRVGGRVVQLALPSASRRVSCAPSWGARHLSESAASCKAVNRETNRHAPFRDIGDPPRPNCRNRPKWLAVYGSLLRPITPLLRSITPPLRPIAPWLPSWTPRTPTLVRGRTRCRTSYRQADHLPRPGAAGRAHYETPPSASRQAKSPAGSPSLPRAPPRPLRLRLRRLSGRLRRPAPLGRVRLGRRLKEVVAADA
jgi:hypothetical protein